MTCLIECGGELDLGAVQLKSDFVFVHSSFLYFYFSSENVTYGYVGYVGTFESINTVTLLYS